MHLKIGGQVVLQRNMVRYAFLKFCQKLPRNASRLNSSRLTANDGVMATGGLTVEVSKGLVFRVRVRISLGFLWKGFRDGGGGNL